MSSIRAVFLEQRKPTIPAYMGTPQQAGVVPSYPGSLVFPNDVSYVVEKQPRKKTTQYMRAQNATHMPMKITTGDEGGIIENIDWDKVTPSYSQGSYSTDDMKRIVMHFSGSRYTGQSTRRGYYNWLIQNKYML